MDLLQLRLFCQVAHRGNLSAAAKSLSMTQPSLSRQIQQLEQALGVELFDRYHRPMTLTPAGHFFLAQIEPLLEQFEQTIQLTQRFAKPCSSDELTIGFVASVLYGLLPEIISRLKAVLPMLDIKLIEISSEQQIAALKAGEIDVGFGRFRHDDGLVRQIFLRHERLVAALPQAHPLNNKQQTLPIALPDLVGETFILYHRTPLPRQLASETDPLLHLFRQYQLVPKHTTKVRDIQIALGLVAAGDGVTLVPDSLKTVRSEQISYRRLRHEDATSPIFLNVLAHQSHPHIGDLLAVTYQIYEEKGITYSQTQL